MFLDWGLECFIPREFEYNTKIQI